MGLAARLRFDKVALEDYRTNKISTAASRRLLGTCEAGLGSYQRFQVGRLLGRHVVSIDIECPCDRLFEGCDCHDRPNNAQL